MLYINKSAQSKIWASIFSAYPGRVGVSRTFEGFGQRDEPAMIAFGEALKLQTKIGRAQIEKRSRELTTALIEGLKKIDGVKIWTSPDAVARAPRCCRSSRATSTSASCRRRSIRRTDRLRDARRPGSRRACVSRRTSTTRTPTSSGRSRR